MSKILKIIADKSGRHGDITVGLVDSENKNDVLSNYDLGAVQSIVWSAKVGELSKCRVETIMSPCQIEQILSNVEFNVRLKPSLRNWISKLEGWWWKHFSEEGRKINKLFNKGKRK